MPNRPNEPTNQSITTTSTTRLIVPLAWRNLSYSVDIAKKGKKTILNNLTGVALPGRTLAVMGGSGAGKTTFLNALAARLDEDDKHIVEGNVQIADVSDIDSMKKLMAFVTQDDIISAMATPYESLYFSIRIRRGVNPDKAHVQTMQTLEELGLLGCKDTIVGEPGLIRGLSGGERKRTNIGVELISDPKVLLLDEPTSGLDSVTAEKLIAQMRELAQRGRTVVFTIHQPNADTASNFDDLLLMVEGNAVYHGPYKQALEYFRSIGYVCPPTYTPTDYFMTILQDKQHAEKLISSWNDFRAEHQHLPYFNPIDASPSVANSRYKDDFSNYIHNNGSGFAIQATELFTRSAKNVKRNMMFVMAVVMQSLIFGIITGLIFLNLKDDSEGVQDRKGVLFMIIINKVFSGITGVIHTFPKEKAVFIREQQAGAYSPFLYFVGKVGAELPIQVFAMVLEAIVVYFMSDLHRDAASFFIYVAATVLAHQTGIGFGLAISASIDNYELAAGVAPMIILPMLLTGGVLSSQDRLVPWKWLEKISIIKYAFVILAKREFGQLGAITCNVADLGKQCDSFPKNGHEVLEQMGFYGAEQQVWIQWVCLGVLCILSRALCVWALYRVAARGGKH